MTHFNENGVRHLAVTLSIGVSKFRRRDTNVEISLANLLQFGAQTLS
jgi:hypothetical protein